MDIVVNGSPVSLGFLGTERLGDILASVDELIDKAGSVIISLKIDGQEIDADLFASWSDRPASEVSRIEISAEEAAAVKERALETLLALLKLASEGAAEPSEEDFGWTDLKTSAADIREAFAGLFAADELSFVQLFADVLARSGDKPSIEAKAEIKNQSDRLSSLFSERLAELQHPVSEMRAAASIFASRSAELADISVLMQTGKEGEAMKSVLFFIEVFNKVIRIIPELRRQGVDTSAIRIAGAAMPEFYGALNDVLRQLTDAFEHKDAVLIGDLAEYEILPRMQNFFEAMKEALPES